MIVDIPLTEATARDVMTREVLSVGEDWSVEELARFLADNSISGAPVTTKSGAVVGVVSLTDLVRSASTARMQPGPTQAFYADAVLRGISPEELAFMGFESEGGVTVREIMTPLVFDVSEDAPLQQVADVMARGHIHRVLVTRGRNLVGIITALDLVRALRDHLAIAAAGLHDARGAGR